MTEREFIHLTRFDRRENEKPIRPTILDEYRVFFRSRVGGLDEYQDYTYARVASWGDYEIREPKDQWPPLSFGLPGKTSLDIWPAYIQLSFEDLTPEVAELVFGLAQLGGLCVWLPKVILVIDETQKEQLPISWEASQVASARQVVACPDAKSFFDSVKKYQLDIPLDDRDYGFAPHAHPIAGAYPDRARTIYIEALPKESAVQHQRKVYKHQMTKDPADRPQSGLLGSTFWELTTPDNVRFYGYFYGGIGWSEICRDFARSNKRKFGVVVNFDTFVSGDSVVPLSECRITLDRPK